MHEPPAAPEADADADADADATHGVSFRQAVGVWIRVAALSFGGPAGQIATMHRIIVEEQRWLGDARFLHALSYCTLLPGPEAQQLAIYIGWLMHRTRGGIVAGSLFVLPGLISLMALSYVYAAWGHVGSVAALFFGLKSAVLAVVLQAVRRLGGRTLWNPMLLGIAAVAFVAIFFFAVPFPLIVLAAGAVGLAGSLAGSRLFQPGGGSGAGTNGRLADADSRLGDTVPAHTSVTFATSGRIACVWLALWLAPVLALWLLAGRASTFTHIATFFSKMAVVTFGGAYAALAYVSQQAVTQYHWLRPDEMLDGLGMAETTPGPLIIVTQFVGFMAAYRNSGWLAPWLAGTLGGLLTTWVTFTPCFLWIFLGGPFIETLRGNRALTGALTAITSAVVGVILNLAIWFALHTWFSATVPVHEFGLAFDRPISSSLNPWALALSAAAAVAIFRFRTGMIATLLACSLAGLALYFVGAGV